MRNLFMGILLLALTGCSVALADTSKDGPNNRYRLEVKHDNDSTDRVCITQNTYNQLQSQLASIRPIIVLKQGNAILTLVVNREASILVTQDENCDDITMSSFN